MSSATTAGSAARSVTQQLLHAYEREYATTMKVLRAFPADQAELRPCATCKTARELAFVFAMERGLAQRVYNNAFATAMSGGGTPPAVPATWSEVIAAIETGQRQLLELLRSADDAALSEKVKFFTGPKTLGDYTRSEFLWFLIHDEIHHRGQFSIYLRMSGAKVPSIYGPSGDEPWT
jgi:uncharacterized damage-inducible protein DinB